MKGFDNQYEISVKKENGWKKKQRVKSYWGPNN